MKSVKLANLTGEDVMFRALELLETACRADTFAEANETLTRKLDEYDADAARNVAAALALLVTFREGEDRKRQFVAAVHAKDVENCRLRLAWAWDRE